MEKYLPFPVTVLVFKTANRNKGSIYEIGILSIESGVELINKAIRIKPKTKTFSLIEYNQDGVTAEDVKNEPEFDKIYPEIAPYIENKIIAMHYAEFHESALLTVLKKYKIEPPKYRIIDLYALAPYMELTLDEWNLKFKTIARACGFKRTNWTTQSKARAIYEILYQFYIKRPSLFEGYIPKSMNKNKQEKIETVEEVISNENDKTVEMPKVALNNNESDGATGCLLLVIIIFLIISLTQSCGYDSDFQKNIRQEQKQAIVKE